MSCKKNKANESKGCYKAHLAVIGYHQQLGMDLMTPSVRFVLSCAVFKRWSLCQISQYLLPWTPIAKLPSNSQLCIDFDMDRAGCLNGGKSLNPVCICFGLSLISTSFWGLQMPLWMSWGSNIAWRNFSIFFPIFPNKCDYVGATYLTFSFTQEWSI